MRKLTKQSIDREIAALIVAGYPPAAILLSRDKYTELLQELAYDRSSDGLEPIGEYEGVLVVIAPGEKIVSIVPNAEVHWQNAAEIDEVGAPVERKVQVRFTEI